MKQVTTKNFTKVIEDLLPAMFDCERVNVVLVHRWKKYMFRIIVENGVDSYETHEMGKGLSGNVALSGNTLWSEEPGK